MVLFRIGSPSNYPISVEPQLLSILTSLEANQHLLRFLGMLHGRNPIAFSLMFVRGVIFALLQEAEIVLCSFFVYYCSVPQPPRVLLVWNSDHPPPNLCLQYSTIHEVASDYHSS